jgi:hypothetical protein
VELIGGPRPAWTVEIVEGDLRVVMPPGAWAPRINGTGTAYIQACYPNGKACSRRVKRTWE